MNPPFAYVVEPFNTQHNRFDFECGVESLDRYLKQQASQDMRRRIAALFVLVDREIDKIAGYYTLASTAMRLAELPTEISKKLPKYPLVPATLLGRLAVDKRYQQQGIGSILLMDALQRSFNSEIASMAVVVDAKDDKARDFYEHHQFMAFPDQSQRLYLPMITIAKLFGSSM